RRPAGVLDRLLRRRHAVDDEAVDLALVLAGYPVVRVEPAVRGFALRGLAGDLRRQVRDIEVLDRPDSGSPVQEPPPGLLDARRQRRDKTETGYDNTSHALKASEPGPTGTGARSPQTA